MQSCRLPCGFSNSFKHALTMRALLLILAGGLAVSLVATAGCSSIGLGAQHDQATIDKLAGLGYPNQSKRGNDLDILVVRTGGSVKLVNRTPQVYHNVELWLNQQYVNVIPRLEIGKDSGDTHLSLPTFIDKHGLVYPVGGLLTPDRDQPLLMAELFDPATGLRHHLLVQNR